MAKEEWRLCAEWLVNCEIIASDHKVIGLNAQVFDLAQVLRDGVLLCHLLNHLHPGSINPKEFSQRPQMSQFLCLKNIRVFLTTCQSIFGIRESDLFEPQHLFDVSDFGRVIQTLSKLSNTPLARKCNSRGFSIQTSTVSTNKDYARLPDIAIEQGLEEEPYDIKNEDEDNEDDIYANLVNIVAQMKSQFAEPRSKRDMCIKELVETEKNYTEALQMVCTHFIRPLKSIILPADFSVIFFGMEELSKIHSGFHSDLTIAISSSRQGSMSISDCFVKWKEKFLIYGEFCSNLPKAQDVVEKLQSKDTMIHANILDCQTKANEGKFRLRDLLSVPMQRVLKYHLLLKELIKNTDKVHPERKSLEKALEEMQDLSLYVNEVKRDNEALQLINEIQQGIVDLKMPTDTNLKDYGRLLKDGEVKVRGHDDTKYRIRYVFLFDKVLLMCKSRGETYNFKSALVLSQYKVDRNNPPPSRNMFPFVLAERGNRGAYTICAKTEEARRKWIEAIDMAQDNTVPQGARENDHEFIMASFNEPTICDVCRKLLRGVFYQGYKCQKTNMVVHKECILKAKNKGPPVVPPRPDQGPAGGSTKPVLGKVKAEYAYPGRPSPENGRSVLTFDVGDVFELLSNSDEHWWEGRFKGSEGYFPKEYVRFLRGPGPVQGWSYEEPDDQVISRLSSRRPSCPCPEVPRDYACHKAATRRSSTSSQSPNFDALPWYAGLMSRDQATVKLDQLPSSSFLIRESVQEQRKGMYALSVKFGSTVRHIRVQQSNDNYFIAEAKVFRGIPEMVEHYQNNTLEKSFPELQTKLSLPYKDALRQRDKRLHGGSDGALAEQTECLGHCRAQFDYAATQPNQLSLTRGDLIAIISKAGGFRGWWKGQLRGKTGYFPAAYVEEEDAESV